MSASVKYWTTNSVSSNFGITWHITEIWCLRVTYKTKQVFSSTTKNSDYFLDIFNGPFSLFIFSFTNNKFILLKTTRGFRAAKNNIMVFWPMTSYGSVYWCFGEIYCLCLRSRNLTKWWKHFSKTTTVSCRLIFRNLLTIPVNLKTIIDT
jgi:hypothetical protein